jgi:hypothetical protein
MIPKLLPHPGVGLAKTEIVFIPGVAQETGPVKFCPVAVAGVPPPEIVQLKLVLGGKGAVCRKVMVMGWFVHGTVETSKVGGGTPVKVTL